jgi:hypothetical protein
MNRRVSNIQPGAGSPTARRGEFWKSVSIDELPACQGVQAIRSLDDILGGWPEEEFEDGFEADIANARTASLERDA